MSEKLYKASDVIGVLMNVCSDDDYLKATDWLSKIPSAVVRCKDCKNWDTTWQNDWAKNYHYCPLIDGTRNGDWYCADGERRSE